MLTLVLFLLFVHNSAVPMILQPLKSLANNKKMIMNKSLVEELADADPAQVQQLLDLIETMLLAAHTNLENLELGCTNANNDYDTAVVTYDAALLSHTGNQEIFDVALEAKNAALEAKVFANGAKVEAQKNLDESKPGLDSEIETLEEMIRLNGQLSSPNQGMTDMLQGMLESAQTILGNLERECTNTINDYNDAVIAYDVAVIAYNAAQEKLRVSQEALNVAQEARDVAQGVKTEAQYVLDTGKPGLEVEISNLEEMLSIHGRLNPNSYVPYPGWRSDILGYSTVTKPCDVQSFVANLPNGYGYYSDPGEPGGWCRTIAPENIETIRSAYGSDSWTQDPTGVTYLTPEYIEGILNSNSCPAGYEYISTEADCRGAASTCLSLKIPVDCSFWKFNKKGSWSYNPKGCFYDGGNNGGSNVFFNTHVTGGFNQLKDRPICKRSIVVAAVTVGPETLITPGGRDSWTGFSMINTNAVVPAHESNQAVRLVGWQWNGFDDSNTITLQIYRQSSGTNYQLIGQFTYDSQKGLNEMVLADGLAVESGDFVGWTFHGSAAVGHSGGSDSVLWGSNNVQFNTVGNTYNFPGRGGRNYPIKANFEIYGPWTYENEDRVRTQFTFVDVAQRYALQRCTPSITTDVTFYVNRDNSRSASKISYLRLDTNEFESFRFDSGTDPDHTHVVFDGQNLICTGVAGKFNSCNGGMNSGSDNNLPEGVPVRAVIFWIDFNPRSGSTYHNQWNRNKYNLKGSYYDAQCPRSCRLHCGSYSSTCYCDEACASNYDCCSDFAYYCL